MSGVLFFFVCCCEEQCLPHLSNLLPPLPLIPSLPNSYCPFLFLLQWIFFFFLFTVFTVFCTQRVILHGSGTWYVNKLSFLVTSHLSAVIENVWNPHTVLVLSNGGYLHSHKVCLEICFCCYLIVTFLILVAKTRRMSEVFFTWVPPQAHAVPPTLTTLSPVREVHTPK